MLYLHSLGTTGSEVVLHTFVGCDLQHMIASITGKVTHKALFTCKTNLCDGGGNLRVRVDGALDALFRSERVAVIPATQCEIRAKRKKLAWPVAPPPPPPPLECQVVVATYSDLSASSSVRCSARREYSSKSARDRELPTANPLVPVKPASIRFKYQVK